MRKFIETTGRSEEDAISAALFQLGLDRDDISVEVLERAKSGFLGFGSSPAKVRVYYGPEEEEKISAPAPEPKKEWTKLTVSVFFNVFLALLVAGMFFVAMTGNNPNILNYQNAVLNKYAAWEQELTEREQAVREKEQELGIE